MEVLDIINIVVDLTNKGSEFSEEIQELQMTVVSLEQSMKLIESHSDTVLSQAQTDTLKGLLNEASALMQNTSKKMNWWQNIKNMLPRSDLEKVKDINSKIQRMVHLINF